MQKDATPSPRAEEAMTADQIRIDYMSKQEARGPPAEESFDSQPHLDETDQRKKAASSYSIDLCDIHCGLNGQNLDGERFRFVTQQSLNLDHHRALV